MMQQSAENRSAIDDTIAHEHRVYEHSTRVATGGAAHDRNYTRWHLRHLVRNGYLITMDAKRSVYACGAVAINGNAKSIPSSERPKSKKGRWAPDLLLHCSKGIATNHLSRNARIPAPWAGNGASSGHALEEVQSVRAKEKSCVRAADGIGVGLAFISNCVLNRLTMPTSTWGAGDEGRHASITGPYFMEMCIGRTLNVQPSLSTDLIKGTRAYGRNRIGGTGPTLGISSQAHKGAQSPSVNGSSASPPISSDERPASRSFRGGHSGSVRVLLEQRATAAPVLRSAPKARESQINGRSIHV